MNGQNHKTQNSVLKKILISCLVALIAVAIAIGIYMIFFRQPIQLPDGSIPTQNTEEVLKTKTAFQFPVMRE